MAPFAPLAAFVKPLLAPLAFGAMGAGTLISAISQKKVGEEQAAYEARVAAEQERQAKITERIGAEKGAALALEEREVIAGEKVGAAKAGIKPGKGSALTLRQKIREKYQRQQMFLGTETAENIRYAKEEAALARMRGSSARRAGTYGMWSSLLTGGAMMGSMFTTKGGRLGFR